MSPEGRTSALSFFDEITADQFREYTTDQIMNILEDRSNVQSYHFLNFDTISPSFLPQANAVMDLQAISSVFTFG